MAIKSVLERSELGFVSPARFAFACFGAPGWNQALVDNRVISASLPGRSFSTHDYLLGSAPVSKIPYRATYTGALNVTFRLDPDMEIRKMLEEWHDNIFDADQGTFGHYEDYTAGATVGIYDIALKKLLYECQLFRVYPVSINPVELSADSQNAYATQSVEFAFHSWKGSQ